MNSLDLREQERRAIQEALDRQKSPAERNRFGQFATPTPLALDMALLGKQLLPEADPVRFLDPGVGSGVFIYAVRKAFGAGQIRSALGFEIDPDVASVAKKLWGDFGLCVNVQDFCTTSPEEDKKNKHTLLLCNPPYVRHHHLTAVQKDALRREMAEAGFRVSGLAGLYGYFLLLAHRWLAPGGVGVWVVPAEFLDVNYGQALKDYLATRVTLHRLHRFDPEDVQFADALVSSVVVALSNVPPPVGHRVQLTSGRQLLKPKVVHEIPLAALDPITKWGPLFTRPITVQVGGERALAVGDLFAVKRGLATGANEFFILEREQARALGLPGAFLRPILPGPRHLPGEVIDRAPDGFPLGLPELVLLDCGLPIEEVQQGYPAMAAYLRQGEQQGIPQRYLAGHRTFWYRQERRPPAPILCTYMGRQNGGRALRFLRNKSDATAPNVFLLLYPRTHLQAEVQHHPEAIDHLFAALTEVAGTLTHGGRVYGGGLNKIEPKELEAVELPEWARRRYGHLRMVRQRTFEEEDIRQER